MLEIAECVGGPRDGERREVNIYGRRWTVWCGSYLLDRRPGGAVYVFERM
jgi:hypothetical protein